MIRIHFFGTCSGTEPIDGRQHLAFALEINNVYYWFDAGENCSRSAYLSGVDLLKVKAIFISHTHMDHIGGLGNLLWNIRKLTTISDRLPIENRINLFIPNISSWNGIYTMLKNTECNFECNFEIKVKRTLDGVVFEDENIRVSAFHNHHLQKEEGDGWLSYSYLIEASGKSIVFSGDVRDVDDLNDIIGDGCDCLIMETGHHKIDCIGDYIKTKNIGEIMFAHHGREIINNSERVIERIKLFPCPAKICLDGMTEEL